MTYTTEKLLLAWREAAIAAQLWVGRIDEVTFTDAHSTPADVLALYNGGT